MNRKISSQLAIGVILVIAIIVGGIFYFHNGKLAKKDIELTTRAEKKNELKNSCQSHYYSGESLVRGWIVPDKQGGKGIVVQIASEDVQNLPVKKQADHNNFTVRLIDPTDSVKKDLLKASSQNPVSLTIKGYAEICDVVPPQISLDDAMIAFKSS